MIYFKITRIFKNDINGSLKGTREDLSIIENQEMITVVKIGYCSDKDKQQYNRELSYRTENPNIIHYKSIPGGDLIDENKLHIKFKDKRIKGKEWFILDNELLEFIINLNSLEDIRQETKDIQGSSVKSKKYDYAIIRSIISVQYPDLNLLQDCDEHSFRCSSINLDLCRIGDIDLYLDRYGLDKNKYLSALEYYKNNTDTKMSDFIAKMRDTSILIPVRLKELCETSEFTDDEKKVIAQQASERFDRYYNLVGPERCKALGYNQTLLGREIHNMLVSKDEVRLSFLETFKPGERYTNKDLKDIVGKIYINLGISNKPKGSDINNYFHTKKVLISKDGIRVNGLEIISEK